MSECVTAWCIAHHRKVFLQGWGPDAGRWCHTNGWPCEDEFPVGVPTFGARGI